LRLRAETKIANITTATALPADLTQAIEIPQNGTLSRTVYSDEQIKVILFGFDAGQELSEHTSAMPAIIQIVRGEARLTLGADTLEAGAGAWVHMPARLPHSVFARTPTVMLLTMLRGGRD
jgi:quercetin dioxygenase-like cupin family protein